MVARRERAAYRAGNVVIRVGDCREVLRTLPDQSVHCCVTSPPYFGLRDYGTAKWEGGDRACDHGVQRWEGSKQTQGAQSAHASFADRLARRHCSCGAIRVDSQIGLEQTPDAYVAEIVAVFREVRRVLRDDGTLWLNLGDSYAATTKGSSGKGEKQITNAGTILADRRWRVPDGLKQKDLIGIPWRVAFALQADGWYLRQDIIWAKPNPMPESVRDRCTKAHEYIFLLSKRERYFYDADAIAEPASNGERFHGAYSAPTPTGPQRISERNGRRGTGDNTTDLRNKRSVWSVASQPFSEAHFATFPPALIEPCIRAGCPAGGTVLDPFGGAGTTGLVAHRLDRNAVLIELNAEYASMALGRVRKAHNRMGFLRPAERDLGFLCP